MVKLPSNVKRRPGKAANQESPGQDDSSIIPHLAAKLVDYEPAFEPTLVLVVTFPDGKSRRRVLLSAHAADKAIKRARERGHEATVHLAELKPVKALFRIEGAVVGGGK